jgi:hypothetical protein
MGYHEVPTRQPRPSISLWGHCDSPEFAVDYFGMDDGTERDPDTNFRFLFQLGQGLYIYLYVIVLRPPESPLQFHTFWRKDCAVVEVEQEELGAPSRVEAHNLELPVVFRQCVLHLHDRPTRTFEVRHVRFSATCRPALALWFSFSLGEPEAQAAIEFVWESSLGWYLRQDDRVVRLEERDRFVFQSPA